jgi:hypothetical protein
MLYPDFFQNNYQKIQKNQKKQNERFLSGFETVKPDEEAKNDQNVKIYGVRKKNRLYPESEASSGEEVSSPEWRSYRMCGSALVCKR